MAPRSPQKKRIRNPKQTRAKLLQAAIELVAEKGGDEGVSLKEAARVATVSRAAAYLHFEDREHLLREAKTWLAERLLESMAHFESTSPEEQVQRFSSLILNNREACALFVTDALAGRDLDGDHPLFRLTVKMLEQFKLSGNARGDIDVEMLSYIMLGSMASLLMLSRARNGGDTEALAKRYTGEWTRILRYGIFAHAASESPRAPMKPAAAAKAKPRKRRTPG